MRTVGVEEELLVVDESGRPVPLGPDALSVASRRGEGEDAQEHDRAEREDDEPDASSAAHLVPELKAQQIELGTPVCRTLAEVGTGLRVWRARAGAAAAAVGRTSRRWPPHRWPWSRCRPKGSATPACSTRSP